MIEKEIKYMMSKDDFYRLRDYFHENGFLSGSYVMKNYYFDTPDLDLLMSGLSFRLREVSGVWVFTYKCRLKGRLYAQRRAGVQINEEYEMQVPAADAESVVEGRSGMLGLDIPYIGRVKDELAAPPGWWEKLCLVATMPVTREKGLMKPYGVPVELDVISYGEGEYEYEIESETDNIALSESVLRMVFGRLGIKAAPSRAPKIVRLLERRGYGEKLAREWPL